MVHMHMHTEALCHGIRNTFAPTTTAADDQGQQPPSQVSLYLVFQKESDIKRSGKFLTQFVLRKVLKQLKPPARTGACVACFVILPSLPRWQAFLIGGLEHTLCPYSSIMFKTHGAHAHLVHDLLIEALLVKGIPGGAQSLGLEEVSNSWPILCAGKLIRIHVASIRELHPGALLWVRHSRPQLLHLGWRQQLILHKRQVRTGRNQGGPLVCFPA